MGKKKIKDVTEANTAPNTPNTGREIARMTEDQIRAMTQDQRFELLQLAIDSIREEEAKGMHTHVKALKQRLELLCKNTNVIGGVEDVRRQIWEDNHGRILSAIHNYVLEYNAMPAVNEIAKRCKLSRQTVHEHLREGIANPYYQEQIKRMEYLTDTVLKTLYKLAINGNVAAGKVFLENVFKPTQPATIRQQNNYLQINNTKIDEVLISELPQTARLQIEEIIKQNILKTA